MPTKPELIAALTALGETQAPSTLQKRSIPWLEERLTQRRADAAGAPLEETTAAEVRVGQVVRVARGDTGHTVTAIDADLQRTIRLSLDGRLPMAVFDQRHPVVVGGTPEDPDGPVLVPLGGTKAVAVARQALAGILPGVLGDDHLAVTNDTAAAVIRALADARPHVNQYGQTWLRLLSRQVAAAFPDAAPAAPARARRTKASAQERVEAVVAEMRAARARKAAAQPVPA